MPEGPPVTADGFVSATGRTVTLPGGRLLAWDEHGRAGDPVVFVFDDAGRTRTAEEIDAARRRGIRLVAIDRPGMGGSSAAPGSGPDDWPADVATLADHLGIREFSVVGAGTGLPYAHAVVRQLADRVVHAELAAPATGVAADAAAAPPGGSAEPVGDPVPPIVAPDRPPRTLAAGLAIAGGAIVLVAAAVTGGVLFAGPGEPADPGPVFRPGALDAILGVATPAELGELAPAPFPAGRSGRATDVVAAADAAGAATPAACARFAYAEPLDRADRDRTDRVLGIADLVAADGSALTAYGRAFPDAQEAAEWLAATGDRASRCADGYATGSWTATAIEPFDLVGTGVARDGVDAVAWAEWGRNAAGESYVMHAAELRRGSIVVRATCTLVRRPDPAPCLEWWRAVADRLAGIPSPAAT